MEEILQFLYFVSVFLRRDVYAYRYCENKITPLIIGDDQPQDPPLTIQIGFNFSMITNPDDPLYEDEPQELCYYAPITMSYTGDRTETVRDMHRDYLYPIIVSIQKCQIYFETCPNKTVAGGV